MQCNLMETFKGGIDVTHRRRAVGWADGGFCGVCLLDVESLWLYNFIFIHHNLFLSYTDRTLILISFQMNP